MSPAVARAFRGSLRTPAPHHLGAGKSLDQRDACAMIHRMQKLPLSISATQSTVSPEYIERRTPERTLHKRVSQLQVL